MGINMPKKILQGTVVSDKQDKTVTVLVERKIKHPVLKKIIKRSKKYMAHIGSVNVDVGNVVEFTLIPPMSKNKRWLVSKIIR